MNLPKKLAVFFMLFSLAFPAFKAQSATNNDSVELSLKVRETLSVSTKSDTISIETNSENAFFALVYDQLKDTISYLPANNLALEENKTYTIIPAP